MLSENNKNDLYAAALKNFRNGQALSYAEAEAFLSHLADASEKVTAPITQAWCEVGKTGWIVWHDNERTIRRIEQAAKVVGSVVTPPKRYTVYANTDDGGISHVVSKAPVALAGNTVTQHKVYEIVIDWP